MNSTYYRVQNEKTGEFIMTAPMLVLAEVFNLREAAVARIRKEAGVTTACDLHFNGQVYFGASAVRVYIS